MRQPTGARLVVAQGRGQQAGCAVVVVGLLVVGSVFTPVAAAPVQGTPTRDIPATLTASAQEWPTPDWDQYKATALAGNVTQTAQALNVAAYSTEAWKAARESDRRGTAVASCRLDVEAIWREYVKVAISEAACRAIVRTPVCSTPEGGPTP